MRATTAALRPMVWARRWLAVWLAAIFPVAAVAQTAPEADPQRIEYQVSQISASAGGLYAYVPDRWGLLRIRLVNPNEGPVEMLCSTYLGEEDDLQFGRRVWIPAQSQLHLSHPIRLPPADAVADGNVPFHTLVTPRQESGDALIRDNAGKSQLSSSLRVALRRPLTGIIGGGAGFAPRNPHAVSAFDLVMTARMEQGLTRQISHFDDQFLPAGEEGLDAMDTLVVARDFGSSDLAGIRAIRDWLYAGGRLWVMLDRTSPELLATLLGDEWGGQVVDRVGLNNVHLTPGPDGPNMADFDAEYEHPVDLVRVVVEDADVVFVANGWPAALRKNCGAGKLLVTTLGAEAWVHPRTSRDPRPAATGEPPTNYAPNPPLMELTPTLLTERPQLALAAGQLETGLREYIGYEVPSRGVIVGLLAAFSAALVVGGVWLARIGRLEWLGVAGPALALAVGGTLAAVGRAQQSAVPSTTALLQFVQPVRGTDSARVTGVAGLYATSAGTMDLTGRQGGWLFPDMSGMRGTTRRLIWSDLGEWHWDRLPQRPGLRQASFAQSGLREIRCEARATFDESGLHGNLTLPPGLRPADGVLATQRGRIAVDLAPDSSFRAAASRVMSEEQFLGADLMSDEQNRRSRILAQLLADPMRTGFPPQPVLLFWTRPWETGFGFGDGAQPVGSALVSAPVLIERPPAGTLITVPMPLLPYRETTGPEGSAPVGLFNNRAGRWEEKSFPSSTWIAVHPPRDLSPLEPVAARLVVRVTGPVGRLEIAGFKAGAVAVVQEWQDPVGTLSTIIRDPELLQSATNGAILLRVSGGDPDRPELTHPDGDEGGQVSYWRIESLDIELQATVVDPPPLDGLP